MIKRILVSVLSLTALILASIAAPAQATSGAGYNGTDPAATGCNQNAYMIASKRLVSISSGTPINAYMQVFYSRTCGTNWVRVTNNPYGGAAVKVIQNTSTGLRLGEVDHGYGDSYSMQIYAPGSTCIFTSVTLAPRPGTQAAVAWAEAVYC